MDNFVRAFFTWARSRNSTFQTEIIEVAPHNLSVGDPQVKGGTFLIGSHHGVLNDLDRFVRRTGQEVLSDAGFSGVDLGPLTRGRSNRLSMYNGIDLLSTLLMDSEFPGHYPALAWVSPSTFTLSRRAKITTPASLSNSRFEISRRSNSVNIPVPLTNAITLRPKQIPFVDHEGAPLALLHRAYEGALLQRHAQYSLAPMADNDDSRSFFDQHDVVPGHEGFLHKGNDGRMCHSLHPFIAVGRLRPIQMGTAQYEYALFDYLLAVLDARSRGVISISRVSVDFGGWLNMWPEISDAICGVILPGAAPDAVRSHTRHANLVERARNVVLSQLDGWERVFCSTHNTQLKLGMRELIQKVLRSVGDIFCEWKLETDFASIDNDLDFLAALYRFTHFIRCIDGSRDTNIVPKLAQVSRMLEVARQTLEFYLPGQDA